MLILWTNYLGFHLLLALYITSFVNILSGKIGYKYYLVGSKLWLLKHNQLNILRLTSFALLYDCSYLFLKTTPISRSIKIGILVRYFLAIGSNSWLESSWILEKKEILFVIFLHFLLLHDPLLLGIEFDFFEDITREEQRLRRERREGRNQHNHFLDQNQPIGLEEN